MTSIAEMASGQSECRTMSSTNGLEPEGFLKPPVVLHSTTTLKGPDQSWEWVICYFKQEQTRRGALHITLCWSRCLPKEVTYWQEGPVIQLTNEIIVSRRKTFGLKNNEYSLMISSIEAFLTSKQRSTYRLVLHSFCQDTVDFRHLTLSASKLTKPSCTSSTSL